MVVKGVPAHGTGAGTRRSLRPLAIQTILYFCDLLLDHEKDTPFQGNGDLNIPGAVQTLLKN